MATGAGSRRERHCASSNLHLRNELVQQIDVGRLYPDSGTVSDYRRDGVVVMRAAFGPDTVETMRGAVARVSDAPSPRAIDYAALTGTPGAFFSDTFRWRDDAGLAAFVQTSGIAALAAKLMESPLAVLLFDQVLVKAAGTACETPWHRDQPQLPVEGAPACSLLLALDPIDRESGGLLYLAGSHRHADGRRRHWRDDPDAVATAPGADTALLGWDLSPGDVLAHDALVLHGGGGNASNRNRRFLATRWCGAGTRFDPRPGSQPLPAGTGPGSKFGDQLFPTLWHRHPGQ